MVGKQSRSLKKEFLIEIRIDAPVKFHHIQSVGLKKIKNIVRDIGKFAFGTAAVKDRLSIDQNTAAVRAVNTCNMTQQCGFPCAIGTNKAIYGTFWNMHGSMI